MALWDLVRPETKGVSKAQLAAATSRAIAPAGRAGSFGAATFLPTDNVEAAINGHYQRCLWVFRCIDAIAQAEVSIPMYAWESHDDGARRVDGYEALEKILNGPRSPNKYEQYWQFRYRISTLVLLSTRGVFIEIVRDDDTGEPVELHILDTDAVQVRKDPHKYVDYYMVRAVDEHGSIVEKKLDSSRVLWLRARPHPKDPYAQVTPLVAAGLSADTDFLARIFNANWLKNDGRPGLLIGVSNREGGGFQSDDLDELKRRFGGGPTRAGETSVIEADVVSVNDLASNPKDAQYQDTLTGSKQDILMAFGVSEPFISWANGRSWDNAQTEIEVVWENTMRWHCKALASVFMGLIRQRDTNEDVVFAHDFSKVRFLHRGPREKAAELRAEYQAGLITADEYREGTGREPFEVEGSSVLWAPSTLMPVGKDDKTTKAAQELLAASRPQQQQGLQGAATAPDGSNGVDPATGDTGLSAGAEGPPQALPPGQPGASNVPMENVARLNEQLRNIISPQQEQQIRRALTGAKMRLLQPPERKSARAPRSQRRRGVVADDDDVVEGEVLSEEWHDHDGLVDSVTEDIARDLGKVCQQMLGSVEGRLIGIKARKGTRHWIPADEEKRAYRPRQQLSEFYIAQQDRWVAQTRADVVRSIRSGASRAMAELRVPTGIDADGIMRASKLVQRLVNRLADGLGKGMDKRVRDIQKIIRRLDDTGASIDEIKDRIVAEQSKLDRWLAQVAPRVAQAAVEGARKIMIDQVPDSVGVAVWDSMRDHRVRPEHVEAHGQKASRGRNFIVGGYRMKHPGDPRVPPHLWINCRCRIIFRRADGREF